MSDRHLPDSLVPSKTSSIHYHVSSCPITWWRRLKMKSPLYGFGSRSSQRQFGRRTGPHPRATNETRSRTRSPAICRDEAL